MSGAVGARSRTSRSAHHLSPSQRGLSSPEATRCWKNKVLALDNWSGQLGSWSRRQGDGADKRTTERSVLIGGQVSGAVGSMQVFLSWSMSDFCFRSENENHANCPAAVPREMCTVKENQANFPPTMNKMPVLIEQTQTHKKTPTDARSPCTLNTRVRREFRRQQMDTRHRHPRNPILRSPVARIIIPA